LPGRVGRTPSRNRIRGGLLFFFLRLDLLLLLLLRDGGSAGFDYWGGIITRVGSGGFFGLLRQHQPGLRHIDQ
jgi:hypothetical protein